MLDLTHPLGPSTPVYPGDPQFRATPALTYSADGCLVHRLSCGTHTGTHLDAPAHVIPGGRTVDQLRVAELAGPALVLRAAAKPEEELTEAALGLGCLEAVPPIVLVRTGWAAHFRDPLALRHPYLSRGAAATLRDLGMRVLGVDTMSPDAPGAHTLPVHEEVLGADGIIVENLRIPEHIPERPWVGIFPLPLAGLDGSPVRAVAR